MCIHGHCHRDFLLVSVLFLQRASYIFVKVSSNHRYKLLLWANAEFSAVKEILLMFVYYFSAAGYFAMNAVERENDAKYHSEIQKYHIYWLYI
jgi:hypothetical protein